MPVESSNDPHKRTSFITLMVSLFLWEPVLLNVIAYLIWQALASLALKTCQLIPRIKRIFIERWFTVLSYWNAADSEGSSERRVSNVFEQPSSLSHWNKWALRKTDALKCKISEAFALKWNSVTLSQFWWTSCQWDLWKGKIGIRPVYLVIRTWMGLVYDSFKRGMIE